MRTDLHHWVKKELYSAQAVATAGTLSATKRSHHAYEARVGDRGEPLRVQGQGRRPGRSTHIQAVVAVLAQEGLEELSHVEGKERQW